MTILELFDSYINPRNLCAGANVIEAAVWEELANDLVDRDEVTQTKEEIMIIFMEQSKRFVACGGNLAERFAVLRKNPESGWTYLIDMVTEKV